MEARGTPGAPGSPHVITVTLQVLASVQKKIFVPLVAFTP